MKKISSLFILLFCFTVHAQKELSSKAYVSVLTCGPGSELYTAFGHSAFRVTDPLSGLDEVYNYGTFDFTAPNFYTNFAKGKLNYLLGKSHFNSFIRIYQYEQRWVKSQVLNLHQDQVQKMYRFLEDNAKPQNRGYLYDFFYDNCATKLDVVTKKVLKDAVSFSNEHIQTKKSHRDLIADYTKNHTWGKFGIDLALGAVIDDEATPEEYKFLPDYIFAAFENATIKINGQYKPLVRSTSTILKEQEIDASFSIAPLIVFVFIGLIIAYISYKNKKELKRTKWLDVVLFLFTGFLGVLVLLLWFATDHTATYRNMNILWAFAPNCMVAFYLMRTNLPVWMMNYFKLLLIGLLAMSLVWIFGVQNFNIALLPLVISLAYRYLVIIKIENQLSVK